MRYLIVVVGRNCEPWAQTCLDSLAALTGPDYTVAVVDDASTDATADICAPYCDEHGWTFIRQAERMGAMCNQVTAWQALEPGADDVVVWVDLDDRLAHADVLNVLSRHYRRGALLTYGSYRSEPHSPTCAPAKPYKREIIRSGAYRNVRRSGGLLYNHLRTVSWRVLRQLRDEDFRDDDGEWWQTGPDAAVMLPCLELAGSRHQFIRDVLYVYRSDLDHAEWRAVPELVNRNHRQMLARPPKKRIRT